MVTRNGAGAVSRGGFSLIEVLAALALFMLVMLLLFRGVTAVTTTVTLGQRQSQLHRSLKTVRRVMEADLASVVTHPDWNVRVGDGAAAAPELMLAFLSYRSGTEGNTETEWVQYWREPHPDETRLERWVRYSAPATLRGGVGPEWWTEVDRAQLNGEVLADDLIRMDLEVHTPEGAGIGTVTNRVEAVDVRIFLTVPTLPEVRDPAGTALQRMDQEDGSWLHFRVRPGFVSGPPGEAPTP